MVKKKILVTGGAGFIGGNIANALVRDGYRVTVFDNLSMGNVKVLDKRIRFIKGDVRNIKQLDAVMKGVDCVIHCAGRISVSESFEDPAGYYETNAAGTLNVLESMRKHHVSRILFSSTAAVYDPMQPMPLKESSATHPYSPYGATKLIAEEMIRFYRAAYGINAVIFRYFNLYGPGDFKKNPQNVIPIFINNILRGKPVTVHGNGTMIRDYIYIDDLVDAHKCSLTLSGYHLYNLGSGRGNSVNDLIRALSRALGKPLNVKRIPVPSGYPRIMYADSTLAKKELGWKPKMKFEEGIMRTVEFFKKRK